MKRKIAVGLTVATTALIGFGCDYSKKPKDSFVERVEQVCGPEIAREYAGTEWRDRDYAQDSLLVACIGYGAR
jgi:hypothetical protein